MMEKNSGLERKAAGLLKKKDELSKLAQSGDAQRLMALLSQGGGVEEAAKSAAAGDPKELLKRMSQLMNTPEGAKLVENISRQAKQSGLAE